MKQYALLLILTFLMAGTFADESGYAETVVLSVSSPSFRLNHAHNVISLAANHFDHPYLPRLEGTSVLALYDRKSDQQLFEIDAPLLTRISIDEENGWIIGMSDIKYHNPWQLFILDLQGEIQIAASIRESDISCPTRESVTNYYHWYSADTTDFEVEVMAEGDSIVGIRTIGLEGEPCEILFERDGVQVMNMLEWMAEYEYKRAKLNKRSKLNN